MVGFPYVHKMHLNAHIGKGPSDGRGKSVLSVHLRPQRIRENGMPVADQPVDTVRDDRDAVSKQDGNLYVR